MSVRTTLKILAWSLATLSLTAQIPVHANGRRDLGTEVLGSQDGAAAMGVGVTGGSVAAPEQVYTVSNRRELVAALNNGVFPASSTPSNVAKIIYVTGTVDLNVDDNNNPLTCTDYNRNGYTLEAFLATYDPAVWGRVPPTGPLEAARVASQAAQQARVRMRIGSNTTIVGVGGNAKIRGAWFDLRGTAGVANSRSNIIIRNITFQDTFDCFPQWAPTDGESGSWNALYDSISLRDSNNVWIDHNTFEDRKTTDATLPQHFGVLYQVHDGLVDITNASDLVTVSWNRFRNHDKVMLIGSSDTAAADRGKLRVTLHHNAFEGTGQRTPRVRFGQVHVYNNFYATRRANNFSYALGVGIESAIVAENNFFIVERGVSADKLLAVFRGTALREAGNVVAGVRLRQPVDLVEVYNDVNDPDLGKDVGWVPVLHESVFPAWSVPFVTEVFAGPLPW
jgi:pectate lyase